jgi:glutamate dehydrogenase/leucine dehydrogenase
VLNPASIAKLNCAIICGAANNQLLEPIRDAALIEARGILYLPDFIVNAGGIIQACVELEQGSKAQAQERARAIIGRNLREILERHAADGISTLAAAHALAARALEA